MATSAPTVTSSIQTEALGVVKTCDSSKKLQLTSYLNKNLGRQVNFLLEKPTMVASRKVLVFLTIYSINLQEFITKAF